MNFKREDPEWKTGLAVLCRRDSGLLVVLCPIDAWCKPMASLNTENSIGMKPSSCPDVVYTPGAKWGSEREAWTHETHVPAVVNLITCRPGKETEGQSLL